MHKPEVTLFERQNIALAVGNLILLKKRTAIFLVLLLLLTNVVCANTPPPFYYYMELGIKEGLSQSKVQCILSDYKGYLWVGTESGLNCYDRANLKQYLHNSPDAGSILSDNIIFIEEDSQLNLWIGTMNGVCLYNRVYDNFTALSVGDTPIKAVSCLEVEGGVLFACAGAIYKYDYKTRQLQLFHQTSDPALNIAFWGMLRYDDEHILLNSKWYGIYSFNLKTNELKKESYFPKENYTSMYLDSDKRLWLAAYGDGLYCFQGHKLIKHFTARETSLTYDVIHDIKEKDNQLWIATDGGGINVIDLRDFSFSKIQQVEDNPYSLPVNTIYSLYVDSSDNIWAGSIRRGLIGIKHVYARSFQKVPFSNRYGLSNQTVNSFFQDSDGILWIGTDGGGINRFDPNTAMFEHYTTTKGEKIVSIVEYSPTELLFFSFNKGLFLFNKHTGRMRPFVFDDQKITETACQSGFSVNVQRIAKDKLLFSAQRILVYDVKTGKVEVIASMGKEYECNSPLIIETVGEKTYLSDLKKICEYDSATKSFRVIYQGDCIINDACMDSKGAFWIASTGGLIYYNPQTKEHRQIATTLFKEATSVVSDNQGRVWIGTRRHLYAYSPQTHNFVILDEADGVLPNEYIFRATLLANNGDVLMGGAAGMTQVNTNIYFDTCETYKIELLDILLNGIPTLSGRSQKTGLHTIEIPWNFTSLQLKVLLNDNDVLRKNMFQFKVEGAESNLSYSNSNYLIINYLPAGQYTIKSSYYTKNGKWGPEQPILYIVVTPPWWETGWFYTCLCILSVILIYGIGYYFYYKRKLKLKREIIQLKENMYKEKISFLTHISHELRTPLTLICAPLKRIINKETSDDDVKEQLPLIYKQAYQMKNIIDMVLDVRKLEEGKEILHVAPHSFNEWIRSVGDKFAIEFKAKGIEITYELDENIEKVPFDKNKCEFVLSNFLMNALKFSEPGTTTTVTTSLSLQKDWVSVSVEDEGIGLAMVDTDALFTRFYQGNHDKGGSGIGLSYAKSLITYHNGRIGAQNAAGGGAVFYFELPLLINADCQPAQTTELPKEINEKVANEIDYTFLKKYSVIIVEDTADLRNYLRDTLRKYFAHVYVAKDGEEGLEQIRQHLPDIIISDVMMPKMNGFELCRAVKVDLNISHIPFILLTAYHNPQSMYAGYKTGADVFLPKPFEVESLITLVHNQLQLREQLKLRYKSDILLSHAEMSFSNADEEFLLKLNAIIEQNMSNPELDVTFLAGSMCISRSLLFNKIKAITGMGIIDYVNKLRIDKSVVLLSTTAMNITEVSEVVGFSSLRYFSKVFKSIKGEVPSSYRKQIK